MKIVQINICDYGSTGKIMIQIAKEARERGSEVVTYSRKWFNNSHANVGHKYFGYVIDNAIHHILGNLFGLSECCSYFGTRKLIRDFKKNPPDIIHLHNLHGWYINLPVLFKYVKKHNISVIWTLHDCWALTGHCAHFTMKKCDKWKTGCHHCAQYLEYPKSYVDNSNFMYRLKKKWFGNVKNMTLVTPSNWLESLVRQSILSDYPVCTIYNGIDLDIFRPRKSNFKEKYGITIDQKIILGVAFDWGMRKGLDVFVSLSKRLDPRKYKIVLVGTNEMIDLELPNSIISIHRTQNQIELAEIYSVADVFVNPTREEVLGLVNIEALACGTPGVTFKTGGSPECYDETCGSIVECDDVDAMEKEIIRICTEHPYPTDACIKRAAKFDKNVKCKEYLELYKEM